MNIKKLKKKTRDYCEDLNEVYPLYMKYLDVINTIAGNIMEIYIDIGQLYPVLEDQTYINEFDELETIELCLKILDSLDNSLGEQFLDYYANGTIKYKKNIASSNTSVVNENVVSEIISTRNIKEVFVTIHEFFHALHLNLSGLELQDEDYYFYSETIAMVSELYAMMYLFNNPIYKDDVISYCKEFFESFIYKADITLKNGMLMFAYQATEDVRVEDLNKYAEFKNFPNVYQDVKLVLKDFDNFEYHNYARYVVGLPFSLLLAKSIFDSKKDKELYLQLFKEISNIGVKDIIKRFDLECLFYDADKLFAAVNYLYDTIEDLYSNSKIDYQKKIEWE